MSDRLHDAIRAVLLGMMPALPNYLRWEYRVSAVSPGPPVLISGVPVDSSCPHGHLASITLWPGPGGAYAVPQVGSRVLVEFHDGNPSKPAVCGLDPSVPPTLTTLGGGTSPIALGPLLAAQLASIASALTSHVHSGVTTGLGTSGQAVSVYTPGNVSSAKVVSG